MKKGRSLLALILFAITTVSSSQSVLKSIEREFRQIAESMQFCVVKVISTHSIATVPKIFESPNRAISRHHTQFYQNIGSGFVFRTESGKICIVTTTTVVQHADRFAEKIEIEFIDGTRISATIGTFDPMTQIVLLSVKNQEIVVSRIGDSDLIGAGSIVLAMGGSYGRCPIMSIGLVSGFESLPILPGYDLIKVNVPINPGNSGGVIVNSSGEVVGMIIATLTNLQLSQADQFFNLDPFPYETPSTTTIGFAIPTNTIREIAEQLIEFGHVRRGWLGVKLDQTPNGILVTEIIGNGPAEDAEIRRGDLIMSYDGEAIETFIELKKLVLHTSPGEKVEILIRRNGDDLKKIATTGEQIEP